MGGPYFITEPPALAHYNVTTQGDGWTWKTIVSGGRKGGKERRNESRRPKNPALKKGREINQVCEWGGAGTGVDIQRPSNLQIRKELIISLKENFITI